MYKLKKGHPTGGALITRPENQEPARNQASKPGDENFSIWNYSETILLLQEGPKYLGWTTQEDFLILIL